jgi:hypothetical protein
MPALSPASSLRHYFSPDQPFGPVNASRITDPDAVRELFDTENKVYAELASHPSLSLIVGRRGSGKTALLRSELLRRSYAIVLELPEADSFQQVVKTIQEFPVQVSPAESVAKVWHFILWVALLTEICEKHPEDVSGIRAYLDGLQLPDSRDPYVVMREALRKVRHYAEKTTDGDAVDAAYDFIKSLRFNDVSFSEAREMAIKCLRTRGSAIILMDSLDDFRLEHQANQNSLKGLLRCQAEFHVPNQPVMLRCCLPAELMNPIYMQLSDNPLKDFGSKLDVTWRADELLRIAAHRFLKYVEFYFPEAFQGELRHYRLDRPAHVKDFWERVMPRKVKNRFGQDESPLAMILRHTQLLPRQLLVILNAIAVQNHRITGNGKFAQFEAEAIQEGLRQAENTICREVFNAFRSTYPNAEEICRRCLPFLPARFRDGELHATYNRHGKALPYATDYEDFRTILIRIGVIGRIVKETDLYIEGEFIYSTTNDLNIQGNELLCVHPVFSRVFNQGSNAMGAVAKLVHPHAIADDV